MTKFDIWVNKATKWLFFTLIVVLIVMLATSCQKEEIAKNKTYRIEATGQSPRAKWIYNNNEIFMPLPILTIKSGEVVTFNDTGLDPTTIRNINIYVDGNSVYSISTTGIANYTYTAK